jgi:hypothetical protein
MVVFHATVPYGSRYQQCLCFMLLYCIARATSNVCVSCCSTIYLELLAMFVYHAVLLCIELLAMFVLLYRMA